MTTPDPSFNDPTVPYQSAPPELSEPTPHDPQHPHEPYAALRQKSYRRYFIGNAASLLGMQMAIVTIQCELYARTHSKSALGMIGFVEVLPIILLTLPAGHIVDRLNRKWLVAVSSAALTIFYTLMAVSSLFWWKLPDAPPITWVNSLVNGLAQAVGGSAIQTDQHVAVLYMLLLLIGVTRSVNQPAKQALMPTLVPKAQFANAVTWNATLYETSNVVGPMLAGFVLLLTNTDFNARFSYAYASIYFFNAICQFIQFANIASIRVTEAPRPHEPVTLKSLLAGFSFVYRNKVILGAITLDMFAVLLGGATALLAVFAADILHVGAIGFAALRAAPSVGAISCALILAHSPPMKNAGRNLLWCVAGFGGATILFGLSGNFWLSLVALTLTGVFDNISVVVRHTLVQVLTPDNMRGRVSAVNSVFISTSNELGAFESGVTADLAARFVGQTWGPMIAVSAGGFGTIVVVAIAAALWPELRRVKSLSHPNP